jgi:SSS family solute:Na+ symporter
MKLVVMAIAFYFLILLFIGLYLWRIKSEEGFILAGRRVSFPLLTATIVSTFYGASAVVGGAAIAYQMGLGVLWFMIPFYLGNIFLLFVLPKIQREDAFTLPDFLGRFYGSGVVVASSTILAVLCLVPESIIAGGKIIELLTPLPLETGMLLISSIIIVYTLLGGMRSVVVSDLLQFGLMLFALVILVPYLFTVNPDFNSIPEEFWNPLGFFGQETLVWCILLFFLPITSAPMYQRIFASARGVSVRKAIIYSVIAWVFIDLIVLSSGLIAHVNYELDDPDYAIFALGFNLLPPVLQAVFFVGLLSAIMSTADSFLHSGASSLSHDVYRRVARGTGTGLVYAGRFFVVLLGILSLLLALYLREIVPALIFLLTIWISGVLISTLAALLDLRLREKAAFYSIVAGSLTATLWRFLPLSDIDPLFIGLACSLIVAAVVTKLR